MSMEWTKDEGQWISDAGYVIRPHGGVFTLKPPSSPGLMYGNIDAAKLDAERMEREPDVSHRSPECVSPPKSTSNLKGLEG